MCGENVQECGFCGRYHGNHDAHCPHYEEVDEIGAGHTCDHCGNYEESCDCDIRVDEEMFPNTDWD